MPDPTLLFDARARRGRVRYAAIAVGVFALVMLYLSVSTAVSYGSSPGDGGQLAPLGTRLAVGGVILVVAVVPVLAMWAYARCYVLTVAHDAATGNLSVATLRPGLSRPSVVPLAAIERVTANEGSSAVDPGVHAPWMSIKVAGRALPFVVDAQGEHLDPAWWNQMVRRRKRR